MVIVALTTSIQTFAQSKIQNWKDSYKVLQTDAIIVLENYYYRDAIWEDEGYHCGGDFSNLKLIEKEGQRYKISGNIAYAQNYCQYTSIASFVIELYSKENDLQFKELEFSENN
jgi:hypothetical protein